MILNRIINYYVSAATTPNGDPRVFRSPITMGHETAKKLIEIQLKREKAPPLDKGQLLHVCFDAGSQTIYLPNASQIGWNNLKLFFDAARLRITRDFGEQPLKPPIEGDPFGSMRIRSVRSFPYANKTIAGINGNEDFEDIPVIEANLIRMPTTQSTLPEIYKNESFMGGLISSSYAGAINFVDEIDNSGRKRKDPRLLLTQKTPFILINMSKEVKATEKEWVVVSGYRDFLNENKDTSNSKVTKNISDFADLYAMKRLLYLGWSFEEVSYEMTERANTFGKLLNAIRGLMLSVESLQEEGYSNPAQQNYYATFKIDPNDFPINIMSTMSIGEGRVNPQMQNEKYFKILDFDMKTSYVIIQTPVFLTPTLCESVMRAKGKVFVTKYNPVLKMMDVKSDKSTLSNLQYEKRQLSKIEAIMNYDLKDDPEKPEELKYRTGDGASGAQAANPNVWNVRFVSNYLFSTDNIKIMCAKYDFEFEDIMVIIGPVERMFGRGTQGGYIDTNMWKENKMAIPYELEKDFWIYPPAIFINSKSMPNYAEQTETIIHEYRHHIFGIQNPNYVQKYKSTDSNKNGSLNLEHWYNYLTDENEVEAHKSQVKIALLLGKSVDEIIRSKVSGEVTAENYPLARKFEELVLEAAAEFEEEMKQNEEPIGTD